MSFKELCKSLESKIQATYQEGVTMEQAEKLAAEFLYAQLQVSAELRNFDLDARMKKSGVKAIRGTIYLDILQKNEKKPTEVGIAAMIDTNELVSREQQLLDLSEVERDDLERYYNIFQNAHIYYRGIAKGTFGA